MDETPYAATDFALPTHDCDLVMKGGVTSGLVYPYAILELAKKYRFRSIGGTSAGGIAAAFAAAAEYGRSVRNDPSSFLRLQKHCEALPDLLHGLFQPTPRFRGLMAFLLRAQSSKGGVGIAVALLTSFWLTAALGILIGGGVLHLASAGSAGVALGAVVGLGAALLIRLVSLAKGMAGQGFGLCPGLTQPGANQVGLVDWLHGALQDIAFNDPEHPTPLTFGDLEKAGSDGNALQLRMMTTNLSMRRPHTLPTMNLPLGFSFGEWKAYFPSAVMTYLEQVTGPLRHAEAHRSFPRPDDLPVLVAVRMSLSFPVLFSAVPLVMRDLESYRRARSTGGTPDIALRRLWFTDGGLSSNFPIHLFDAILPSRPTFALSLDELPRGADEAGPRVSIPKHARDGVGLPIYETTSLLGFVNALLGSAKDWQDNLLASLPGQRERIARVLLSKREGGLNLTMPVEVSRALMGYGREVGKRFVAGDFDFEDHRWRRSLVAYEQIEATVAAMEAVWGKGKLSAWFKAYGDDPKHYRRFTKSDRTRMRQRLDAIAALQDAHFTPAIQSKDRKMPRPKTRLRLGPDL